VKYFFNYTLQKSGRENSNVAISNLGRQLSLMVALSAIKPQLLWRITYVLNDHDEERQLDGKSLLWVQWAGDVVGGHIGSHDLEDGRLNVWISNSLDVTVANVLVPNLERLGATNNPAG
jgi:hypothetical protein